jgi:heme/copper-type cytochrome/quinol oxidase subunit 1
LLAWCQTWTALCTNVFIVAAFPMLTVVLALLSLDRYVGQKLIDCKSLQ